MESDMENEINKLREQTRALAWIAQVTQQGLHEQNPEIQAEIERLRSLFGPPQSTETDRKNLAILRRFFRNVSQPM